LIMVSEVKMSVQERDRDRSLFISELRRNHHVKRLYARFHHETYVNSYTV
jgi:hypothetical protein